MFPMPETLERAALDGSVPYSKRLPFIRLPTLKKRGERQTHSNVCIDTARCLAWPAHAWHNQHRTTYAKTVIEMWERLSTEQKHELAGITTV